MPKLNQFVWVLDYKSVGNGAVVPQSIDVQSGRRNELLNMPIFFLQNWGMLGLRLNEAVVGVPKGLLLNGNYAPALVGNCNTISICINWPGYGKWTQSRPISTSRISLDRLAELVAAAVWEFIETAGQQDADHVWRIGGRRGIKSRDIKLIGLIHVRQNIWHPILQLSDDYASSKSNVLWS
ncbi:hypothetical protein BJV77DRAFT_806940 [Russula vinacea]|nr:hypothetical protein BJV77DRAFT_806940 [Russula vinacea]